MYSHLDGTTTKPEKPLAHTKPDTSPVSTSEGPEATTAAMEGPASKELTAEQVSLIEKYSKDLNKYSQEQAIVFQQIASMIPDSLYLKIKGKPIVKEAWDALKANFERRLCMIIVKL